MTYARSMHRRDFLKQSAAGLTFAFALAADPSAMPGAARADTPLAPNLWVTITPDGTITMPLVGDIKASGETPSALKERIKQQLANFLKMGAGNEVTVAVRAWKSYRFTIEGEVARSGVFSNDQYVTVSEALAMAGGLSRFAKHDEIRLMRHDKRGYREIPLDFDALASGKRPDMNIYVMPGDQIYVP